MNFNKQLPHPALQSYIHHYAFAQFGLPNSWSTLTVVPPGCAVMAVVVGDKKVWLKDGEDPIHTWALLNFVGQVTQNKKLEMFGQQKLVYVIFQPCGAYRLLGVDQHHCINSSSDLLDLISAKEGNIQQQFEDCQTPEETLALLEALLLRLLVQQKEKHHLAKITSISEYIKQKSHEPLLIKKMCKEEGFSKSTLERHFMEIVGIGPKQYHRIVRFNNVLRHISQQNKFRHWTEVVYRFGYYDQAHFIKEFNTFYGKTPSAFSTNDELLSNVAQ